MFLRYDQGMNTHHEPTDRNHPAIESLAREVLEREERLSAYTYSIPLAAQAFWDATRSEQVKAAPALARAVLELIAARARPGTSPEPLPCGCENPFNAVHLLDH